MTTMEQVRAWRGPVLFSYGFRPFFLGGGLWAGLMVALWVPWFLGWIEVPSALAPLDWHVHELLFGYVPAVIAGFLLTAVPNWTGRLPVVGAPLAALFAVWLLGRAAVALSAWVGLAPALAVAAMFPAALLAVTAREVIAGGNRRNLPVVGLLGLLAAGQIAFAAEAVSTGGAFWGQRVGVAAVVMLIALIGGRVTPSFTANWLRRRGETRLPAPFGPIDKVAMIVTAAALIAWVAAPALGPAVPLAGALALAAAALLTLRLARWRGGATRSEPILAVLHVGYAFLPLGFALAGAGLLGGETGGGVGAVHAWTAGAAGVMTLAVMTRATLGHTGRALHAGPATTAIYAVAAGAAAARIAAALAPQVGPPLLTLAAVLWTAAFLGFACVYGPMLARAGPSS